MAGGGEADRDARTEAAIAAEQENALAAQPAGAARLSFSFVFSHSWTTSRLKKVTNTTR